MGLSRRQGGIRGTASLTGGRRLGQASGGSVPLFSGRLEIRRASTDTDVRFRDGNSRGGGGGGSGGRGSNGDRVGTGSRLGSLASLFQLAVCSAALVTGVGLGTSGRIRPGRKAAGPPFGGGIRSGREGVQGGLGAIRWGRGGAELAYTVTCGAVRVAQTRPPAWGPAEAGRGVVGTVGTTGVTCRDTRARPALREDRKSVV